MQSNDVIDIRSYVAELVAGEDDGVPSDREELSVGTELLRGQFVLTSFLNSGGFGITYRATNSLLRDVVIKECFLWESCQRIGELVVAKSPAHQARFDAVKAQFIAEAHGLAALEHPNIVQVHQVFEENRTAYIAMDHIDGPDLLTIIEQRPDLFDPEEIEDIARGILGAVAHVHSRGMLHRDVAPDNILIDRQTRVPYLIDFGAAFHGANTAMPPPQTALKVVKDGYSPYEFYVSGIEHSKQSDLYSIAATLYHLIAGELPVDAETRTKAVEGGKPDPLQPIAGRFDGYQPGFLEAIDVALALDPADRMASAGKWLEQIPSPEDAEHTVGTLAQGQAAAPKRSKRRLALAAGLAAALGAAALAVYAVYDPGAPTQPEVSGAPETPPPPADQVEAPVTPLRESQVAIVDTPSLGSVSAGDPVSGSLERLASPVGGVRVSAPTPGTTPVLPLTPFAGLAAPNSEAPVEVGARAMALAAVLRADGAPTAVDFGSISAPGFTAPTELTAIELVSESSPTVGVVTDATFAVRASAQIKAPVAQFARPPDVVPEQVVAVAAPAPSGPFSRWDVEMPFTAELEQVRNATVATITSVSPTADLERSGAWIAEGALLYALNEAAFPPDAPLERLLLDALQVDPDGFTRATVRYRGPDGGRIERGLLAVPVV
ncbi:MAG: protein kinase, partial [Pseudomonadota bacterium]